MSNESIRAKKERIRKLLNWIRAQKRGVTVFQIHEFLFDNYALSESVRTKYIKDLRNFKYLIAKGGKLYVKSLKASLF